MFYRMMFSIFLKKNYLYYLESGLVKLFLGGLDDIKGFSLKGWYRMLWGFFFIITLGNLWGLVPYVYGVTTKIYVVLFLALWGWGRVVFSSIFTKSFLFFGHFCPAGAPTVLG